MRRRAKENGFAPGVVIKSPANGIDCYMNIYAYSEPSNAPGYACIAPNPHGIYGIVRSSLGDSALAQEAADRLMNAALKRLGALDKSHTEKLKIVREAHDLLRSRQSSDALSFLLAFVQTDRISWAAIGAMQVTKFEGEKRVYDGTETAGGIEKKLDATTDPAHILNVGIVDVRQGDLISLSYGFEHYLGIPEFIRYFVSWPENLDELIRTYTRIKAEEDADRFGGHRILTMLRV